MLPTSYMGKKTLLAAKQETWFTLDNTVYRHIPPYNSVVYHDFSVGIDGNGFIPIKVTQKHIYAEQSFTLTFRQSKKTIQMKIT